MDVSYTTTTTTARTTTYFIFLKFAKIILKQENHGRRNRQKQFHFQLFAKIFSSSNQIEKNERNFAEIFFLSFVYHYFR